MLGAGAVVAASLAAAPADFEPGAEHIPGSAKNRPGGNKPVPGGGKREAGRRLARMQAKCQHPDMQPMPDAEPPYDVCPACGFRED